jgi:hypothetical protein
MDSLIVWIILGGGTLWLFFGTLWVSYRHRYYPVLLMSVAQLCWFGWISLRLTIPIEDHVLRDVQSLLFGLATLCTVVYLLGVGLRWWQFRCTWQQLFLFR